MKSDIHNIKQSLKTNQEASVKLQKVNIFIFGANMLERFMKICKMSPNMLKLTTCESWSLLHWFTYEDKMLLKINLGCGMVVLRFSLFQDLSKKIAEQRNAYISASSTVNQTLAKQETSVKELEQVNCELFFQDYCQV